MMFLMMMLLIVFIWHSYLLLIMVLEGIMLILYFLLYMLNFNLIGMGDVNMVFLVFMVCGGAFNLSYLIFYSNSTGSDVFSMGFFL